jgi:nitrogen fixation NifU-like protein
MEDLRELYQSVILDHNKAPRNFGALEGASSLPIRQADGHNPICGDKLTVYVRVDSDDRIDDVRFQGSGCAISTASASLMTDFVKGKTLDEVGQVFESFHQLVTSSPTEPTDADGLGKLAVFGGVREFPMRVKCATLSWHTLNAALEQSSETAKTE